MVICFLCTKKNNNDIVIDHQLMAIIAMIITIRNQWVISENIEDLLENLSTYHEENEENASPNQWPSIVEANSMKNENCLRDYFCYFFVIFYSVCFSFVLCVCELWLRNRKIHISWKSAACHSDMENAGKCWKILENCGATIFNVKKARATITLLHASSECWKFTFQSKYFNFNSVIQ